METSAPNKQENWELTAAEIAEIERINTTPTFKVRVHKSTLIEIEVEAHNFEDAEGRALNILEKMPEAGEVLRSDFGHRTIERV